MLPNEKASTLGQIYEWQCQKMLKANSSTSRNMASPTDRVSIKHLPIAATLLSEQ